MTTKTMCDGACYSDFEQVCRVLPTGGDSNAILCHRCYLKEMAYRSERNKELGSFAQFTLPAWQSLKVYDPGE